MRSVPAALLVLAVLAGCSSSPSRGERKVLRKQDMPHAVDARNYVILGSGVSGSGQPDLAIFPDLAERGYSTIINLRFEREHDAEAEREAADAAGLHYVNLPISRYALGLREAAQLKQAISSAPNGSILIHCGSGNRVGALWGLMQAYETGMELDEAIAYAQRSGYRGDWADPRFEEALRPLDPRERVRWED